MLEVGARRPHHGAPESVGSPFSVVPPRPSSRTPGSAHGTALARHGCCSFSPISLPSTRRYMVPDPPGLFDGHVWPMYQKYKREMEANGVEVGKSLSKMRPAPPHWDHLGNLKVPPRVSPPVSLALGPRGWSVPAG